MFRKSLLIVPVALLTVAAIAMTAEAGGRGMGSSHYTGSSNRCFNGRCYGGWCGSYGCNYGFCAPYCTSYLPCYTQPVCYEPVPYTPTVSYVQPYCQSSYCPSYFGCSRPYWNSYSNFGKHYVNHSSSMQVAHTGMGGRR
jgi:hypothetical protein